jgi:hypothetical protein
MKNIKDYYDIIHLSPLHQNRKKMPLSLRAKIFSPFAALDGYEDKIDDKAKIKTIKKELTDDQKNELNDNIIYLSSIDYKEKEIMISYYTFNDNELFINNKKSKIKRIDLTLRNIILKDKEKIDFDNIIKINILE